MLVRMAKSRTTESTSGQSGSPRAAAPTKKAPAKKASAPTSARRPKGEDRPVVDGDESKGVDQLAASERTPVTKAAADRVANVTKPTPKEDIERQAGDPDKYPDLQSGADTQAGDNTANRTAGTVGHKPSPYETSSTGLNTGQRERAAGQSLDEANEGLDDLVKIGENEGKGDLSGARTEADPAKP